MPLPPSPVNPNASQPRRLPSAPVARQPQTLSSPPPPPIPPAPQALATPGIANDDYEGYEDDALTVIAPPSRAAEYASQVTAVTAVTPVHEAYELGGVDEFESAPAQPQGLVTPHQPALAPQGLLSTPPVRQPVALAPEQPAPASFDSFAAPLSAQVMRSVEMLMSLITNDDSSEVLLNGPNEIMFKKSGSRYHAPEIMFGDAETYHRVINEFILPHTDATNRIDDTAYLVEGQLEIKAENPNDPSLLARVHVIAPPVVKFAKVTIAKKARNAFSLDDLCAAGAMTRQMAEFLKACSYGRLTTVFSGLSGAGKTTMLEAMTHEFDQNDRIVVVEDTPELRLPIADTVYMTSTSVKPGVKAEDTVTVEWLVRATQRMRPDRIIVGEVRGAEMSEFLIAANSGADGSMTTVHASDPARTLDKILGLAMKSEGAKNEMSVRRDIASTVQLIVQLTLIDGKHIVSHIEEISQTIRREGGAIATTTIFSYDRSTGRHAFRNKPSEQMLEFVAQRGVEVNPAWFR